MKDTLITVAGLTPQVITETIYCFYRLRKPPVRITEVYVITTLPGKEKIKKELIENGLFNQLCKRLNAKIRFDEKNIHIITDKNGNPLNDIKTLEDNERAAEVIWNVLANYRSRKDLRIHCSVAGGRKTMGVYLALCMSLLGRKGDTLSHVLVDDEKESTDFYFPKSKEEERKLSLAEIPYIELGEVLKIENIEGKINFIQRIREYKEKLHRITLPVVEINYEDKNVEAKGIGKVRMSEREFLLYSLMVEKRAVCACERGCNSCFLDVSSIFEEIKKHAEKYWRYFNFIINSPHAKDLNFKDVSEVVDRFFEGKEEPKKWIFEIISRTNTKIEKSDILHKDLFKISRIGSRGNTRYGLKIPPEKLCILRESNGKGR